MRVKVEWKKNPFRTYYCWTAHYGNIVTESQISPEHCFDRHLMKLKRLGVDTRKFGDKPVVIKESE